MRAHCKQLIHGDVDMGMRAWSGGTQALCYRAFMAQPTTENRTPFTAEALFLSDEETRPLLVLLVKATYTFDKAGQLHLAPEQAPLCLEGEWWGKPGESSYKLEPESAFIKPATDVVLMGSARAQAKDTRELRVSLEVGPVRKSVRVVGDRVWFKSLGSIRMTEPRSFEAMPLRYERSFGGRDTSNPDPAKHGLEPRNPVGVGFRTGGGLFSEGLRLPNLEDPDHPIGRFGQVVPPAGFGFISPDWMPRVSFAGTYDAAWRKQRMPLLPRDFSRRFFNAASPGLVAPGYLRGDEPVSLVNATPEGRVTFRLPGIPPPRVRVQRLELPDSRVETHLDTVILDADERRLFLLWRGLFVLDDGPHEVRSLEVTAAGVPVRPPS